VTNSIINTRPHPIDFIQCQSVGEAAYQG